MTALHSLRNWIAALALTASGFIINSPAVANEAKASGAGAGIPLEQLCSQENNCGRAYGFNPNDGWQLYFPPVPNEKPNNTLETATPGKGYMFFMNEPGIVNGIKASAGWNAIGIAPEGMPEVALDEAVKMLGYTGADFKISDPISQAVIYDSKKPTNVSGEMLNRYAAYWVLSDIDTLSFGLMGIKLESGYQLVSGAALLQPNALVTAQPTPTHVPTRTPTPAPVPPTATLFPTTAPTPTQFPTATPRPQTPIPTPVPTPELGEAPSMPSQQTVQTVISPYKRRIVDCSNRNDPKWGVYCGTTTGGTTTGTAIDIEFDGGRNVTSVSMICNNSRDPEYGVYCTSSLPTTITIQPSSPKDGPDLEVRVANEGLYLSEGRVIAPVGAPASFNVRVTNKGSQKADGFTFKYNCGSGGVAVEKSITDKVLPGTERTETVTCNFGNNGKYFVSFETVAEGDVNAFDNWSGIDAFAVAPNEETTIRNGDYFLIGPDLLHYQGTFKTTVGYYLKFEKVRTISGGGGTDLISASYDPNAARDCKGNACKLARVSSSHFGPLTRSFDVYSSSSLDPGLGITVDMNDNNIVGN